MKVLSVHHETTHKLGACGAGELNNRIFRFCLFASSHFNIANGFKFSSLFLMYLLLKKLPYLVLVLN